jgi:hypothetical protein
MRKFQCCVLIVVSVMGSALLAQTAAPQAPAARPAGGPNFTPVASILELMQEMVDPVGDALFESVSVVITAQGSKETKPRTDAEWFAVRNNAIMLAEAGNLLKIPRPVAPTKNLPGVSPEKPGPDDLSPPQVEILLKKDRRAFEAFAQKLTDAALVALRAVDTKNADGLYEAGDAIDQACENCHLNYWYPGPNSPVRKNLK